MTERPGTRPVVPPPTSQAQDRDAGPCPCPDCDTRPPRQWTEEELGPELPPGATFDGGAVGQVIDVEQQPDRSWWACCDEWDQRFGPFRTKAQASARTNRHAPAIGEVTPDER